MRTPCERKVGLRIAYSKRLHLLKPLKQSVRNVVRIHQPIYPDRRDQVLLIQKLFSINIDLLPESLNTVPTQG